MIPSERRAEKLCMDALLQNKEIKAIFGRKHIYQGYVEPNTLTSVERYILIRRIDAFVKDQTTTGAGANQLRRVRLQLDISDTRYCDMVANSELVADVLSEKFPSCVDNDTYGTDGRGQKVFNVCHLDILIYESTE